MNRDWEFSHVLSYRRRFRENGRKGQGTAQEDGSVIWRSLQVAKAPSMTALPTNQLFVWCGERSATVTPSSGRPTYHLLHAFRFRSIQSHSVRFMPRVFNTGGTRFQDEDAGKRERITRLQEENSKRNIFIGQGRTSVGGGRRGPRAGPKRGRGWARQSAAGTGTATCSICQ